MPPSKSNISLKSSIWIWRRGTTYPLSDLCYAQIGLWLQRSVQVRKWELLDAERSPSESSLRREVERRHRRHVLARLLWQSTVSRIIAKGKSVLFSTFPARPHVRGKDCHGVTSALSFQLLKNFLNSHIFFTRFLFRTFALFSLNQFIPLYIPSEESKFCFHFSRS